MKERGRPGNRREGEREGGGADVTGKHKKVNEMRGEKTARKRCGS